MTEKFVLPENVLDEASQITEPKKSKLLRNWLITGGLFVVVVTVFLFNLGNWFAPSDFKKDIPLEVNISRWDSLRWGAVGDFEKDNTDTSTGTWSLNTETGEFTTANTKYDTCSLYFNKTVGDYGDFGDDLADTENYSTKFFEGDKNLGTDRVWVKLKGYDTRGVEVMRTRFVDDGGNTGVVYYRHSPLNKTVFFGTIRCGSDEQLDSLVPENSGGEELNSVGVWLRT